MIVTEILILVVTFATVFYTKQILKRILIDDAFETHVFNGLDFQHKINFEQNKIVQNIMYIFSVLFLFVLRFLVPFSHFELYSWFHLYVFVQTYMLFDNVQLSHVDKGVAVAASMLYYVTPSNHMDNLILFSTLHLGPIVTMDTQLFDDKAFLRKYHKRMLRLDTALFVVFWQLSLLSFCYNPCLVDIIAIPISFYYQLFQKNNYLDYKKKV